MAMRILTVNWMKIIDAMPKEMMEPRGSAVLWDIFRHR